jgi:hypothetical protein
MAPMIVPPTRSGTTSTDNGGSLASSRGKESPPHDPRDAGTFDRFLRKSASGVA